MLLAQVLARVVSEGQLTIIDGAGRSHRLVGAKPGPTITLRIHDWWTGIRLAFRPRLALGEAYMDGRLTVEEGDLYDLLDLLGRNIAAVEATPTVRWSYAIQRSLRLLEQYNPVGKAQKNVAHHYDLRGELYDFFLDRDRQYSCAYFRTGSESLETAHADQKQHIAAKLLLKPGQKVLDLGSGWGGMGLYLARAFNVDVTGVTLSREQHAVSSRRVLDEGVADSVRFKLLDYREEPLEQAQLDKKQHIAAKMLLQPGQKVLDIGSGWGGMGLFLSQQFGVDVTGVTLSKEQHTISCRRALEGGVADRVRFKLLDYRQEPGRYDRIVSVGMFEHVGSAHYVEFFTKVKELLDDDGVMLLHSIGRMEPPGGTNTWLRRYIFPGGYTPALSEVLTAIEKVGLWVTDMEILRLHYAETLRHWRQRFLANRERIKQLAGYDDRFCRMWEFYLAGCEISFRYLSQFVFQMQIARRQTAVPLTRDYMLEAEHKLPSAILAAE